MQTLGQSEFRDVSAGRHFLARSGDKLDRKMRLAPVIDYLRSIRLRSGQVYYCPCFRRDDNIIVQDFTEPGEQGAADQDSRESGGKTRWNIEYRTRNIQCRSVS